MTLSLDDVTRLPGPEKRDCPCPHCAENPPAAFGTPRKKAWADGLHHVKGCACRRCVGSRQKPKARRREHKVARDTGGTREPLSGALSGVDGRAGIDVWEETSAVAITRGFRRWIESKGVQSKTLRLMARIGVRRHLILSWDGKPRWVVTPYEDWAGGVKEQAS